VRGKSEQIARDEARAIMRSQKHVYAFPSACSNSDMCDFNFTQRCEPSCSVATGRPGTLLSCVLTFAVGLSCPGFLSNVPESQ
ncbi:unnamed protein product, partial [Prorocentrum cordatum]